MLVAHAYGPLGAASRQIGPRKFFVMANWTPENLLEANWAPESFFGGKLGPWKMLVRQIGPQKSQIQLYKWTNTQIQHIIVVRSNTNIYIGESVDVEFILLLDIFWQQLGNICQLEV